MSNWGIRNYIDGWEVILCESLDGTTRAEIMTKGTLLKPEFAPKHVEDQARELARIHGEKAKEVE